MRKLLFTVVLCLLTSPVWAADVTSAWVRQLTLDGYDTITINRTWLGRARILAEKGETEREIILNRRTGEVLRDYTRLADGSAGLPLGFEVRLGGDGHNNSYDGSQGGSSSDDSTGASDDDASDDSGDGSDDDGGQDDHEDSSDSSDGGESDESDESDEGDDD